MHVSMPMKLVAVLSASALLLAACGDDSDPAADDPPGDTQLPEDDPDDSGDTGDTGEADDRASSADPSELELAECRSERFTIAYPRGWETNDDDDHPACRVFHPDEVELPERPQDLGLHWAASVYVDQVPWEDAQPDEERVEILSSRETEVDGHRASVHEIRAEGEGLIPEGERRYGYTVDLEGRTLFATTHSVGDTDYERDREILDRMMAEVTIHEGDETPDDGRQDGDDPEEVVSHDVGQREFRVTARSIADGICLTVHADGQQDEACGPVEEGIDLRRFTVAGEEYVAGIVAGAIAEIDMIANDGSAIADEHATAELVEIIGQSGYRAFAPARAPSTYQAVVGYDHAGEEVARAEL